MIPRLTSGIMLLMQKQEECKIRVIGLGYVGPPPAVAHREFFALSSEDIHSLGKPVHVTYDIKFVMPAEDVDGRL